MRRATSGCLLRLALLGVLVLARPVAAGDGAATDRCAAPSDLVEDDPLLPAVAQRLAKKQPLTIVALGGASTAGLAAGDPAKAYPRRLEEVLGPRYPGVPITVINKGMAHQTARDMVERMTRDVLPERPALVLWETGITDAVRGIDVDEFTDALQSGIDRLHEAGIEVMLIDMQFGRDTTSVINFEPYIGAMREVADLNDVYLFRRFDIMKYWSESGQFNFRDVPKSARAEIAAEVYDCLARRLADAIAYAAR